MTMQNPAPIEAPSAIKGKAVRADRAAPGLAGYAPDVVLRRYASLTVLAAADVALLRSLAENQSIVGAGQELGSEGEPSPAPRLILSGWACRFRMLADGRRTILNFLLPGDAVCSRRGAPALASTAALTPCRLTDARPLWRAVAERDPAHARLAHAHHLLDLLDDCYLLDHVVRLARQTAIERMCHLLLELNWRLGTVGLVRAGAFALPLTQEAIGDAVGLSIVHVNRMVQNMRRRGLIELHQGRVVLLQPERMAEIAEFSPPLSARAGLGGLLAARSPPAA